eukprot:CAMPEP_0176279306 /NCGR_PEP_ID=MMETSP0121_2-20121125/49219_1 /TAXON_ID=160619 /ORGANISM="Kryptoperidinium foliaceum, Strain CCMP 1326" /LENGTH=235 /DNA_ID=CAMNT_0017619621 /DNA_START=49 /DNA_END=753 /DNA_ORIENTATION=+
MANSCASQHLPSRARPRPGKPSTMLIRRAVPRRALPNDLHGEHTARVVDDPLRPGAHPGVEADRVVAHVGQPLAAHRRVAVPAHPLRLPQVDPRLDDAALVRVRAHRLAEGAAPAARKVDAAAAPAHPPGTKGRADDLVAQPDACLVVARHDAALDERVLTKLVTLPCFNARFTIANLLVWMSGADASALGLASPTSGCATSLPSAPRCAPERSCRRDSSAAHCSTSPSHGAASS